MRKASYISPGRRSDLQDLLTKMEISCRELDLLNEALTHSSFAADDPEICNYERLEFFGDAVLKFVVSEYLFIHFTHLNEGDLTEICSVLVRSKTLEEIATYFELHKYIRVGKGVAIRPSIMSRSLEAILGAIYLDSGFTQVKPLIIAQVCSKALEISQDAVKENYKNQLQQLTQSQAQGIPAYRVIDVQGPEHNPTFCVSVFVGEEMVGEGVGPSKKAAEQAAAKVALIKLLK